MTWTPRLFASVGLAALVAVTIATAPAQGKADGTAFDDGVTTYVALGDSFAAGPLIPLQRAPYRCLRSTNNYARLLATRLDLKLRDATCSSAETRHMFEEQVLPPEAIPPQLDRLDAAVDLVTLQIGGNDIGFAGIAESCVRAAIERASCKERYVGDGRDDLRERIAATAPDVAAVLREIEVRSPGAAVLVLGYPGIFSFGGTAGCPAMGVSEEDALYLRGVHEALNAMIAEQAARAGATYVDVYGPSEDKTACDLPLLRWVEPVVPVNAAYPIHPNLTGMLGVTGVLAPVAAEVALDDGEPGRGANRRPGRGPTR